MQLHAQWDTGWLIWVIILAALAGICWLVTIAAGTAYLTIERRGHGQTLSGPVFLCAIIAALIIGAIGTFVAFPFAGQYHRYIPQSGTVAALGSRFLASDQQGGGTTQKFVVTFTDGQSFGCLDTRCANVVKGDQLTLLCKRAFQFNAPSPGWDCNWGADRKADGSYVP